MKASRLRLWLNFWPPFLFSGMRVTHIADDYRHARVELRQRWYNRNYVGTHFGGSLFAMTDPFWMIMVLQRLGPGYLVWDQAGRDPLRQARPRHRGGRIPARGRGGGPAARRRRGRRKGAALVRHGRDRPVRRRGGAPAQAGLRAPQAPLPLTRPAARGGTSVPKPFAEKRRD